MRGLKITGRKILGYIIPSIDIPNSDINTAFLNDRMSPMPKQKFPSKVQAIDMNKQTDSGLESITGKGGQYIPWTNENYIGEGW